MCRTWVLPFFVWYSGQPNLILPASKLGSMLLCVLRRQLFGGLAEPLLLACRTCNQTELWMSLPHAAPPLDTRVSRRHGTPPLTRGAAQGQVPSLVITVRTPAPSALSCLTLSTERAAGWHAGRRRRSARCSPSMQQPHQRQPASSRHHARTLSKLGQRNRPARRGAPQAAALPLALRQQAGGRCRCPAPTPHPPNPRPAPQAGRVRRMKGKHSPWLS